MPGRGSFKTRRVFGNFFKNFFPGGKKQGDFSSLMKYRSIPMKTNVALCLLLAAGLVLSACSGSPAPVDSRGNIQPTFQNFTPGKASSNAAADGSESKAYIPQYNPDGSITVFTINNIQVRILPMTGGISRGALSRSTEEFDAMITQYTQALEANPQDYEACIMLAGLYVDRASPGDAEKAIKYSDQALAIGKDDPQALLARGLAYAEQGDSPKALTDLEAILKMNIQSMKGVYYIMAKIHFKDGKTDEAIDAIEKVKAIDPGFADIDQILEELYSLKS
jgi:tetratricopeptide (TPR) repeat protein